MSVTTSGYCKITGLSKAMPSPHYIPMMPALSQAEQSQLFGCKITMASHMDHHYVPVIEFGKGKGPGIISCKVTGRVAESIARPVALPEEGVVVKRVHHFKRDLRYMEPFISRLANPSEKKAMEELLERMRERTELEPEAYYVYSLNDRRTGKTGMVLPYEYEEAIRTGAIESILLSGDSNSLVVRIKDGPVCTIPMDKVSKTQVERLSSEEMLFDGHGPDREVIEKQRLEKAAREKEDREQMAQYLAEMEQKRKEREMRKKDLMKSTMKRKLEEAEEAERRQKQMDEEIKKQYAEAAEIRRKADEAKKAALEAARERANERDRKLAEERAREAEEAARLAEEQMREAERLAAEKAAALAAEEERQRAEERAAAEALAAIEPYDMSVNELLDHMKEKTGEDEKIVKDMEEAAAIGMSATQIAGMFTESAVEAIEEAYAEPEEEEEEEEEEEVEEEVEEERPPSEEMTEEQRLEMEMLAQMREEMLEQKRQARRKKRQEQMKKDEDRRLAKEARAKKKAEMMQRLTAMHRADADEEEAERQKWKPPPLEIPLDDQAEYLVQTRDGKVVLTQDELDEASAIEGRIDEDKLTPGRAIKTKSGIEFIAGRILTTEEGREFVPGEEVELPEGPKFIPGQTVETPHGPQFVAGKTIGEGENIEFVPGHVVNLGEDIGEIFVPGQVMETDEGPKFIPGNVHRCRRAGPLFVPGQLRNGEYIPGKIVETEDGPRFVSPKMKIKEEQFTFAVQTFDLHPIELDLMKYQYRSPEPSPVFQGQDIQESLNLMQMAARGYQAKTLPPVIPPPPPPKSRKQIYENVRLTFLSCIDVAQKSRDASENQVLSKDSLTRESRRLQHVLADDIGNPMTLNEVGSFLRKCLSLQNPTDDIGLWIEGLFGNSEMGIFRPLKPMVQRKLSRKVSLQKTLVDLVQELDTELQEARRRDIILEQVARVLHRELPRRTHVDDYRERWLERISGILLTAGKVVLNHVFCTVAYNDENCVKSILNQIRDKLPKLQGDSQTVDILETVICNYVQSKMANRLEELLSYGEANSAPNRDGLTQELIIKEAVGFSLLEDEPGVARFLQQCLETPDLVGILPIYRKGMDMLRTVINMHCISDGDQRLLTVLGNLSRCPSVLCDNEHWIKLVSGAMVITQHVWHKNKRLKNAGSIPNQVVELLAKAQSPEVDKVFHEIIWDASWNVHGRGEDLPILLVKNQFEGVIPREMERDVIDGKIEYLLVNETSVKLMLVGGVEEHRKMSMVMNGENADIEPQTKSNVNALEPLGDISALEENDRPKIHSNDSSGLPDKCMTIEETEPVSSSHVSLEDRTPETPLMEETRLVESKICNDYESETKSDVNAPQPTVENSGLEESEGPKIHSNDSSNLPDKGIAIEETEPTARSNVSSEGRAPVTLLIEEAAPVDTEICTDLVPEEATRKGSDSEQEKGAKEANAEKEVPEKETAEPEINTENEEAPTVVITAEKPELSTAGGDKQAAGESVNETGTTGELNRQ